MWNYRSDTTLPKNHWDSHPQRRTKSSLEERCRKRRVDDRKGCVNPPLINIDPEDVIVDELHLMLRVTDRLLKNLFLGCQAQDHAANHKKPGVLGPQVKALVSLIRRCGVGFSAWFRRNANQEFTNTLDFISLNGDERKKVLRLLPDLLPDILPESYAEDVVKLWRDFGDLYATISSWSPTADDTDKLFTNIKQWVCSVWNISWKVMCLLLVDCPLSAVISFLSPSQKCWYNLRCTTDKISHWSCHALQWLKLNEISSTGGRLFSPAHWPPAWRLRQAQHYALYSYIFIPRARHHRATRTPKVIFRSRRWKE